MTAQDMAYGRQGGRIVPWNGPATKGRPCDVCDRPMLLGQKSRHYTCSPPAPCCGWPIDLIGNEAAVAKHQAAHLEVRP